MAKKCNVERIGEVKVRNATRKHMKNFYDGNFESELKRDFKASGFKNGRDFAKDGNFYIYSDDKRKFLKSIYGAEKVNKLSDKMVDTQYDNLIGKEIDNIVKTRK